MLMSWLPVNSDKPSQVILDCLFSICVTGKAKLSEFDAQRYGKMTSLFCNSVALNTPPLLSASLVDRL